GRTNCLMTDRTDHRYVHSGLRIRSEIELFLPPGEELEADVKIVVGPEIDAGEPRPTGVVIGSHGEGENWWYTAIAANGTYILDVAHCGRFVFTDELSLVTVRRDPA